MNTIHFKRYFSHALGIGCGLGLGLIGGLLSGVIATLTYMWGV